ncbi:GPI-anchored surface protein, putative [Bodo saltans]|uniref:GPI-anchored surface protein, putative n=1 Tax=Bodo saltans TaxID=75058 RepID=A0A0S4JRE5_BODSA|nr:GPI-anchored surface protein, putative [Bodo saltans]|eukprot:CUG94085.1 GPI-anchored surface protein, putative [Bodo saltans]
MDQDINVQLNARDGGSQEQTQGRKARLAWFVMILTTPVLSPFLLIYLLIYQFCLVGVRRLSAQAKAVTAVLAIFLSIAWVPVLTSTLYFLEASHREGSVDAVNAFAPPATFFIFCAWGSVVAFRHFSISDSYEPETERSNVRRLKDIEVDPPLLVLRASHVPAELREQQLQQQQEEVVSSPLFPRNGVEHGEVNSTRSSADFSRSSPPRGEAQSCKYEITNALQLYQVLKGDLKHTFMATSTAVVLSAATVSIVRTKAIEQSGDDEYSEALYVLSTFFFCGMFLVFYSTFAFIITIYLHQVSFIRSLTYALDDNAPPRQRVVVVEGMHLKQLRAWEECRRLAVEELTNPKSILNAVFTPSMWLSALGTISIFTYLVVRLLFQRQSYGQLSIASTILLTALIGFMACAIGVAKVAQKHFKRHSALIAQKTFDIARQIDVYHTNLEQGIEDEEEESVGGRRVSRVLAMSLNRNAGGGGGVGGGNIAGSHGSRSASPAEPSVSLAAMEQIYASLHSLCTYMIANQPRPLILGIELRHVRFVVVFVMLISGNVLFVSLMIAFKSNHCGAADS